MTAIPDSIPPSLRDGVSRWLERLPDGSVPPAHVDRVLRVVASSEFAGRVLLRYWGTLADDIDALDRAPDIETLRRAMDDMAAGDPDTDTLARQLREIRNRWMLHILWREILCHAEIDDTLGALSTLADELLRGAALASQQRMAERFGHVRDEHGAVVPLVILGMGKLGGRELNFSSDIDLIFTYPTPGESDGAKSLHAQEYFDRMSRQVIALIDELTADGFVYRVDTRLRPFGDSGPPVVSFAALESYLLQHGREWERYAYVKARIVGAHPGAAVESELFDELISPFVYRRYLDFGVFESLREMHAMIASQVQQKELADNVKIGPGGIREIEFIVQSLQLVRGGDRDVLRERSLRRVLPLLVDGRSIDAGAASTLDDAYVFLRRLENFIQAIRDKQTHDLPADDIDRARLCLAMGFEGWDVLVAALDEHRGNVTRQFERVAIRTGGGGDADPSSLEYFEELWEASAPAAEWIAALEAQAIENPQDIAESLLTFGSAAATRKVDLTSGKRLQKFIPRLLALASKLDRPDIAIKRSLSVIEQVLRRSAYLALLNENQLAAERLVRLCERSAYIAGEIARFPVLLDELLDPRPLTQALTRDELDAELRDRLVLGKADDTESRTEVLAQFQRATMFRIAVADFNGSLPLMKVSDSLTWLAETVLEAALEWAWGDLIDKHGAPRYTQDGKQHAAGFGIIAYGKLGGLELSYGSDLDIVFLHDSVGTQQQTDGDKPLDNALFFSRLVRRLVHILTTHTSSGVLYDIDTRLRPSGRKGLLVTSVDAFERYQEENAWTWEHQALLRARAVAGSAAIARAFERVRTDTLRRRVRQDQLRDDVLDMRRRMRDELDRSDAQNFDIKQGEGGVGDIEFLVQYLVLSLAADNPSVIEFTDNIRQLDALAECGGIASGRAAGLQETYRQYRQHQHHRVLNDEPPLADVAAFGEQRGSVQQAWRDVFGS